jgi:fructose/tagatose bisphosphate aldolase
MILSFKEQLRRAAEKQYAVVAPDFPNLSFARLLIRQAEEQKAPLILSYHDSFVDACEFRTLDTFFRILREECEQSSVPLTIHLDHA